MSDSCPWLLLESETDYVTCSPGDPLSVELLPPAQLKQEYSGLEAGDADSGDTFSSKREKAPHRQTQRGKGDREKLIGFKRPKGISLQPGSEYPHDITRVDLSFLFTSLCDNSRAHTE